MRRAILRIVFAHALGVAAATAGTIHVDGRSASAQADGRTWRTALRTVQAALEQAGSGDEIWVARGTYHPGDGSDRGATFQLKAGVALCGGFAGTESNLSQRDARKNATILDGRGVHHVVTGADGAVLDGFTITGGNGLGGDRGGPPPGGGPGGGRPIHMTPQGLLGGAGSGSGAGMVNYQASPTVRNCIFENNKAGKGGAVYNMTSASFPPRPNATGKAPVFIDCIFRKNSARGRGGGVSNDLGTSPTFLNCVFEANETPQKGGGMYNDFGCSPTLINCLFTGNSAQSAAGMGNDGGSSPVLYYCTFTKNHAEDAGASLYQGTGPASNPSVILCLVAGNTCDWEGPGIYNWHDNSPRIEGSVFETSDSGDAGYKPGRFVETDLPRLLTTLVSYRAQPVREPVAEEPERIPSSERIVYVDAARPATGDGRGWSTAHASLSAALEDAGSDGAQIWVKAGTYSPGPDRTNSFVLRPGIRLYGGFAGTETQRDQRDAAKHATVLNGHRAYHVLVGANGAVLDGFTVTGGRADGAGYDGKGGGLINYRRAPQSRPNAEAVTGFAMEISHCTFTNNAARDGGAVYSYDRARPVFRDCVFAGNRAENGGAVLDRVGVEARYERCEFTGNAAQWRGGAVYFDYGSRPVLTGCVFRANATSGHGGAAFSVSRASQLENTVVTLSDCRFEGNRAKGDGGAANFHDSSVASIERCVFAGNRAGRRGNAVAVTSESTLQSAGTTLAGEDLFEEPSSGPAGGEGLPPRMPGGAPEEQQGAMPRAPGRGEQQTAQYQPAADFSVIVVGSGSPEYNPQRSGPCAAIQHRGRILLVDMGNGTQARLSEAGISLRQVDAFVFTHHHRDHNEEFMPLLGQALVRGMRPEVVGPPQTKKLVDFTMDFYAEDMKYRIERTGRAASLESPDVREVEGGESFSLGELRVKTAQVPHTIHTCAYRFEAGGQSIVISGDLTYSDKLIELARGADVLVIDGGRGIMKGSPRRSLRQPDEGGERRGSQGHPSLEDVATMGQKSGAKCLVLTHLTRGEIDEEATITALHEVYPGRVVVGRDLLEVTCAGAAKAVQTAAPPSASRSPFIQRLDRDGDGRVSRGEFDGPPDRIGDFDRNGDGFITEDEAPQGPLAGAGGRPGPGRVQP
jgi:ribonuclease BN (tRNA processing enzyme)